MGQMFVAIVNTPGYLPESEPAYFDTAQEAWQYLTDERQHAEDDTWNEGDSEDYSETHETLKANVRTSVHQGPVVDTVHGDTPGYTGDHDLGVAYSVEPHECDSDCAHDTD